MIPYLRHYLQSNWERFSLGEAPKELSFTLKSGGSRIVLLAFKDADTPPCLVAKVAHGDCESEVVKQEHRNLGEIHRLTSDYFRESIPHPIVLDSIRSYTVSLETCVSGIAMDGFIPQRKALPQRKSAQHNIKLALEWLGEFHARTKTGEQIFGPEEMRSLVEEPIKGLQGPSLAKYRHPLVAKIQKVADGLIGATLPLVFLHHDFFPPNILLDEHKVNVVDWEHAQRSQLPIYDPFWFIVGYVFRSTGTEEPGVCAPIFRDLIVGRNYFSDLVSKRLDMYRSRLNMDFELMTFLRLKILLALLEWVEPGATTNKLAFEIIEQCIEAI